MKQLDATYLPSRGPLRIEKTIFHHMCARALEADGMQRPGRDEYSDRKFREAIAEQMKGLESAGFRVIDKEVIRPLPSRRLRVPPLPIAIDQLPLVDQTIRCLSIASSFRILDRLDRAANWIQAAMWRKSSLTLILAL